MSALSDAKTCQSGRMSFGAHESRDPDADEFHHRSYVSDQGICEQ